MNIAVVGKSSISSGTFLSVKNIAYNATTHMYTLTKSDDTTVQYSSDVYYLVILWN